MPTCRYQITQWVKDQIDGQAEINLPQLAASSVDYFASDPEFVRAFLDEMLRPVVYDVARSVVSRTRSHVVLGDDLVTRDSLRERSSRLSSRTGWETWLEHAGSRHVRLMDMTRDDLRLAAAERRGRAESELAVARLLDALAERLEGAETVGERFSSEEIDAVFASVQREDRVA